MLVLFNNLVNFPDQILYFLRLPIELPHIIAKEHLSLLHILNTSHDIS